MTRTVFAAFAFLLATSAAGAFEVDETLKEDRETARQVQTELKALDYSPGVIDGIFGPGTQRAIEAFHADHGAGLTVGLTPEVVERIGAAHASWFEPPHTVRETFLGEPEDLFTVDITDIDPDCDIPECTVNPVLLAAADLTGDGAPELVIGTVQFDAQYRDTGAPSPVLIMVNDGAGGFSHLYEDSPAAAPRRVHPREAAIADLNGDNIDDLFIAAHGLDRDPFRGEANLVMLSNGRGGLTDVSNRVEPQSAMNHGVAAHNVDGDGDTDLFVITNWGANTIDPYFLINNGRGRFALSDEAERLTPSLRVFLEGQEDRSKSTTARFIDVNADGHSDLIFAISGDDGDKATRYSGMRRTRVVLNDGGNRWLKENASELPVRRWGYWTYTTDVDGGDVDNDGDIDLLLTESTRAPGGLWRGQHHQLLLNDGGRFTDATATHLWKQGYADMMDIAFPIESFLVDLDGDRDLDIVVRTLDPTSKGPDAPRIVVALNDGNGRFSAVDPRSLSVQDFEARQLRPADIDGDGDIDLVGLKLEGEMLDEEFYTGGFTVQVLRNRSGESMGQ